MKMHRSIGPALALAIALTATLGCGGGDEGEAQSKTAEAMTEALMKKASDGQMDVDIEGESMTIRTKDGPTVKTGAHASVPDGWPDDVMIYDDATLLTSMDQTGQARMLVLESDDASSEVAGAYRKSMSDEGWAEDMSMNMGEIQQFSYSKGERSAAIQIMPAEGKTRISITVQKE